MRGIPGSMVWRNKCVSSPVAELEPLSETIETVLLLARASTGGISMERAVRELSS